MGKEVKPFVYIPGHPKTGMARKCIKGYISYRLTE